METNLNVKKCEVEKIWTYAFNGENKFFIENFDQLLGTFQKKGHLAVSLLNLSLIGILRCRKSEQNLILPLSVILCPNREELTSLD